MGMMVKPPLLDVPVLDAPVPDAPVGPLLLDEGVPLCVLLLDAPSPTT
jgi:hypothetical protein